jgi:3-hydroxymyristoyl/3-hydroxydecanoyl-(acyl carrier protein) dehydratase
VLIVEAMAQVAKRKSFVAKMYGTATVDGVVVAEAEVMCKLAGVGPATQPTPES